MWKAILAALLYLQPPGQSLYSQVVVPEDAPAPCSDSYSLLCSAPKWSEAHGAYTRVETWGEGLRRYVTIAHAADVVVYKTKRSSPRAHLLRYLLAFVHAESGMRADVHSGIGHAAAGDCDWRGEPGKRERVPGSCRSWCLTQIQVGPMRSNATVHGHTAKELVGLDLAATVRCLDVATSIIDRAYQYCAHRGPRPLAACIVSHYAGGMIASTDPRVLARVRTVNKLYHAPTKLEHEVLLELGIAADEELDH